MKDSLPELIAIIEGISKELQDSSAFEKLIHQKMDGTIESWNTRYAMAFLEEAALIAAKEKDDQDFDEWSNYRGE